MAYCTNCGQEIPASAAFCSSCGAPVKTEVLVPVASAVFDTDPDAEERAFLENTHRLLRWEQKAWSIASKVWIIMGSIFTAVFLITLLYGIVASANGDSFGGILIVLGIMYTFLIGGMFIGIGIVNAKAAQKIPQYLDTVYTDFSLAYNRCRNVGMLVFNILFGVVSPVFFIINFVRMQSNHAVIERILKKQSIPG